MPRIEDAILVALAEAGSLRALSAEWGVSTGLLSSVLSGRKRPGPKLLGAILGSGGHAGMIVLVSGATRTFERFKGNPNFGRLKTPANGNAIATIAASGAWWAADNSCFTGFDEPKYVRMIEEIPRHSLALLLWVAAPDVVGDSRATLDLFARWRPRLGQLGLPVALVGQDGAESLELPWSEFRCLFLGGSTAWKLSAAAEDLAKEAKRRGKLVHMGRVNSARRMRHAWEIGCDSVDGQSFSAWPDRYFPKALRDLAALRRQPSMF